MPKSDLSQREYLRPNELYAVFGVRASYLRQLYKRNPSAAPKVRRLPGGRGVLLFHKDQFRSWIEEHTDELLDCSEHFE